MSEEKIYDGFMSDKPTTTAQYINERIASNEIIIEQQKQIDDISKNCNKLKEGCLMLVDEIAELKKEVKKLKWVRPDYERPEKES